LHHPHNDDDDADDNDDHGDVGSDIHDVDGNRGSLGDDDVNDDVVDDVTKLFVYFIIQISLTPLYLSKMCNLMRIYFNQL